MMDGPSLKREAERAWPSSERWCSHHVEVGHKVEGVIDDEPVDGVL